MAMDLVIMCTEIIKYMWTILIIYFYMNITVINIFILDMFRIQRCLYKKSTFTIKFSPCTYLFVHLVFFKV